MTTKEILPLTSLRFFAALYVFLFHFQRYQPLAGGSVAITKIIDHGAIGMSLFFILSGFVLAYHFNDGIKNIRSYAFMRFSRIYPVYFLAAIAAIPMLIDTFSKLPHDTTALIGQGIFIIFVNVLMLQAWMPQLTGYWNDGASWSISAEAFFYAVFPLILGSLGKLTDKRLSIFLALFLIGAVLPGLSFFLFPNPPSYLVFYSIPIFRVCEFGAGVVSGLFYARGYRAPFANITVMLCVVLLGVYLIYGPDFGFVFVADSWAVVPIFSALIFSCASLRSGLVYKVITNRAFVGLGHISYSFYSMQALLLYLTFKHYDNFIGKTPFLESHLTMCFATFCALALVATVLYLAVEVAFRKYLNHRWGQKKLSLLQTNAISAAG